MLTRWQVWMMVSVFQRCSGFRHFSATSVKLSWLSFTKKVSQAIREWSSMYVYVEGIQALSGSPQTWFCKFCKFWTLHTQWPTYGNVGFNVVGWLCWGLTSQSTIFQSCRDGAIASWVINQYLLGLMWVSDHMLVTNSGRASVTVRVCTWMQKKSPSEGKENRSKLVRWTDRTETDCLRRLETSSLLSQVEIPDKMKQLGSTCRWDIMLHWKATGRSFSAACICIHIVRWSNQYWLLFNREVRN